MIKIDNKGGDFVMDITRFGEKRFSLRKGGQAIVFADLPTIVRSLSKEEKRDLKQALSRAGKSLESLKNRDSISF